MTAEQLDAGVTPRTRRPVADIVAAAADRMRRVDVRGTWQLAAGAVMAPLGALVVLVAWYGAAHTPYVQQQVPYLVSGSFIGLGLMILGGLLFWAHWLYRLYDQADLHHAEQLARQEALFERLFDVLAAERTVDLRESGRREGAGRGARPTPAVDLVVTAGGTNVHRPDCPIVARHADGARRLAAEEAAGRPPCRICQPRMPD